MAAIVTLATGANAVKDLRFLLWSLEQVYKDTCPDIYIYTDTDTSRVIPSYKGNCYMRIALDSYTGLNRQQMEKIKGSRFKTKWTDFMCEKIAAMDYAFEKSQTDKGLWFLDADIMLFDKLPEIPEGTDVALAPHYICPQDEAKYGRYNGGFLWLRNPQSLQVWLQATHTSRFYEQAALEAVAASAKHLYEIPIQHNFGWWRMWQSTQTPDEISRRFGYGRNLSGIGLTFDGKPLASVHTHWYEKTDPATYRFNDFIKTRLQKINVHRPAAEFAQYIRKYA
jgi:hypothetical protein